MLPRGTTVLQERRTSITVGMIDNKRFVGIIANMGAELIYRNKKKLASGAIVEVIVWRLPAPNGERPHGYKYRLYYGRDGERIVGYDNERGKGDHRHYRDREVSYAFTTVAQLLADFQADVLREEGRS